MTFRLGFAAALAVLALAGCGSGSGDEQSTAAAPTAIATSVPAEVPPSEVPATAVPPATSSPEPADPAVPATAVPVDLAPEEAADLAVEPVVYNDDFATTIAPIFADHCASCHNDGGPGSTHWQLESAADLVATHEWISTVVEIGYMPPWPASELSLPFHDDRSLRPDEIEAIRAWSSAGAELDVDPATPIVNVDGVVALDADVEIGPLESFQGSPAVADDYRCLIYDLGLTEDRWIRGFEFAPDQEQIVHHAIGYLAPASALAQAQALSAEDELGGWQCYGGSGLDAADDLFLGWAPGQLPTEYPDGAGLRVSAGDFVVLQIHYHFDTADAPEDASTLRVDWADGENLTPIEFDEFIGPAEIPCSSDEVGPLCEREAALAQAYARYGIEGVLADGINQLCGVDPSDFAHMTTGIASSECTIPIRNFGEIVAVFGHQHELGKSIRMTLNAGRADERILLDIPDWSFDWQYNYYPSESVVLAPGDTVLLECEWDRSRRPSGLEPAYVLWADGTNDEMCFATISTLRPDRPAAQTGDREIETAAPFELAIPAELVTCLSDGGVVLDGPPDRSQIDALITLLSECDDAQAIAELLTELVTAEFGGLVGEAETACLAERLGTPDATRDLLVFLLEDSTDVERRPVGEVVGDCVPLSALLANFGFPLSESARACVDEAGRDLLIQATIDRDLPEEQVLFQTINPCLSGGGE